MPEAVLEADVPGAGRPHAGRRRGASHRRWRTALLLTGVASTAAIAAGALMLVLAPRFEAGTGADGTAPARDVRIGHSLLRVPDDLAARRPAPPGSLDLVVPLEGNQRGRLDNVILMRLSPADAGDDPAERARTLYARFLTSDVWTNPGGLVSRRFRAHSPFESEELYLAPPDGRRFAARCPRADRPDSMGGLCVAQFRDADIDILVSFSPRRLPDWQAIERRRREIMTLLRQP